MWTQRLLDHPARLNGKPCPCDAHRERRRAASLAHEHRKREGVRLLVVRRVLIEQRIALGWSDQGIADVLDRPVAEVASVRRRMDELVGA